MTESISPVAQQRRGGVDSAVSLGLVAVLVFFVVSGIISYSNVRMLRENNREISHTHDVLSALNDLLITLINAETGQRGYLLTSDIKYLDPYNQALSHIDEREKALEELLAQNPAQLGRFASLKTHVAAKIAELNDVIRARQADGAQAAHSLIATDRGKAEMDAIRAQARAMTDSEEALRLQRIEEMRDAYRIAVISGLLTGIAGIALTLIVALLLRRAAAARRRQQWLQDGETGLSQAMLGDQRLEQLGDNILRFLAEYFDAHAGLFFVKDGGGYRRVASYGVPAEGKVPERFDTGDGLLGQAARDAQAFFIRDVPEEYISVGSGMGQGKPRHLIISPAVSDGGVNAVFELGFLHPVDDQAVELLRLVSEAIGIAVRSANYRTELQNFLEETQRQAEELQAQSEELRVSNEELEEQSRALKESQARLEQQQAELEQTNAQLEEQAQILETQKDDLERANEAVRLKAQELEEASQYKSDFLANMSHELRTPLNSSLILAKLLADNADGNLTDEQVRHAQTIQSSGNDLLVLINDILDLSKIEAGHMEIVPENVPLSRLAEDVSRLFLPIAQQKDIGFGIGLSPGCPETVYTDRQRLEQILKNLLSNAFKFTEKGRVDLLISCAADGNIDFSVVDTGIGISEEQQKTIFDAFRQADSTISRKYGGTGLGLSISRELVRLLGGTLRLRSEQGKGSTFTVTFPASYSAGLVQPRAPLPGPKAARKKAPAAAAPAPEALPPRPEGQQWIEDDREKLAAGKRTILVIEDDTSFARILYDLAREADFQCLIAATAAEGLVMARQYVPSAIVLDVGLPDDSGLLVLDRIKRDARTRHIPVHIVSAGDYTQTAFSLGAIGYMLKPVRREELMDVLKRLENRLEQRMRRVLIVEDDNVQREAVSRLLGSHDVETVGVGTVAECLERLREQVFDCMVLDLSLPDASGYSLLETLSREDAYSFPPVIVYTGRALSPDEEHKLHRYSKSIIIKGAKSPERLLDEVTLFLHQVVSELPPEQQKMIQKARNRDAVLEGRRILIVEDEVRNVYSLTNILEPRGAIVQIARNGREAIGMLEEAHGDPDKQIDLVLMDVMMPVMDGLAATREIRRNPAWKKLPVIMLTAKAMRDDQERCLEAGANDYMAKPLDVEKLLSLVRVWMPR
jgi:signal transduction histidine kinase/CheY-like chemotaxis protein/CHASE3 domain sensor protein